MRTPPSDPAVDTVQDELCEIARGDHAAAGRADGWLCQYARTRDPGLRERVILVYLGLADRLAMRFRSSSGTTLEDLVQIARTALVAAVDRYDPGRGRPFVPYAVSVVVGELKRTLRDTTWRVHVPRTVQERTMRLCRLLDELPQRLHRSPTITELAGELDATEAEVLEALEAAQTRQRLSLDQPAGRDGVVSMGELLAAPGPVEEPEDLVLLPELVGGLPEQEREVVLLRFFGELTQDEIAERIGHSQMQVSRLLRRALGRLHDALAAC